MKSTLFVVILCVLLAVPALADPFPTVRLKETSVNPGLSLTIHSSGYNGGTWAGVYNLNVEAPGYGPLVGAVESFCIDIWDYAPGSYQTYDVKPLDQAPDPGAGAMGTLRAGYLATLLNTYWTDALTGTQAATLQTAVWEIVDEGNVDLTGPDPIPAVWDVRDDNVATRGNFYVSNDTVANLANSWLANVRNLGVSSFGDYAGLSNDTSGTYYQDYVVKVPVPAAFVLGLLGLSVAGARLRKRA